MSRFRRTVSTSDATSENTRQPWKKRARPGCPGRLVQMNMDASLPEAHEPQAAARRRLLAQLVEGVRKQSLRDVDRGLGGEPPMHRGLPGTLDSHDDCNAFDAGIVCGCPIQVVHEVGSDAADRRLINRHA